MVQFKFLYTLNYYPKFCYAGLKRTKSRNPKNRGYKNLNKCLWRLLHCWNKNCTTPKKWMLKNPNQVPILTKQNWNCWIFFNDFFFSGISATEYSELEACDCYGDAFLSVQSYKNRRVLSGLFIPESVLMVGILELIWKLSAFGDMIHCLIKILGSRGNWYWKYFRLCCRLRQV